MSSLKTTIPTPAFQAPITLLLRRDGALETVHQTVISIPSRFDYPKSYTWEGREFHLVGGKADGGDGLSFVADAEE